MFRTIKLPLLLVAVAPLLIASFAYNFNNFNVIYMLTGGGPRFAGHHPGHRLHRHPDHARVQGGLRPGHGPRLRPGQRDGDHHLYHRDDRLRHQLQADQGTGGRELDEHHHKSPEHQHRPIFRPSRAPPLRRLVKDKGWRHLVGVVVIIFAVFPLLYILSASLNSNGTLAGTKRLFTQVDVGNFIKLFNDPARPFGSWFINTLVIGVVTSAATVFLGAMAAYAFSRMRFKGRRVGLLIPAPAPDVPAAAGRRGDLPSAQRDLRRRPGDGLGSQLGLIMVYLGGALGMNTCLMYGFFNTFRAIDEAAKIDGASHVQIFFGIILRLVKPILVVMACCPSSASTASS